MAMAVLVFERMEGGRRRGEGAGGAGGEGAVLTCFIKLSSLVKPNSVAVG